MARLSTYEAHKPKPNNPTHHPYQHLVEHRKYDQLLSRVLGFCEVGKLTEAMREREHLSVALQSLEGRVRDAKRNRGRQ